MIKLIDPFDAFERELHHSERAWSESCAFTEAARMLEPLAEHDDARVRAVVASISILAREARNRFELAQDTLPVKPEVVSLVGGLFNAQRGVSLYNERGPATRVDVRRYGPSVAATFSRREGAASGPLCAPSLVLHGRITSFEVDGLLYALRR